MKIELSDVFVVHTDAITTNTVSTPIGIDALEPRSKTCKANRKARRFWPISTLLTFFRLL